MIDILVIGDDPGLTALVENGGIKVYIYSDEIQALTAAKDLAPAILFLFYDVRERKTPEYVYLLKQASHSSKIVLIGRNVGDEIVIECLMQGAQGFISEAELPKYIHKLIPALLAGEAWVTRRMTVKILEKLRKTF